MMSVMQFSFMNIKIQATAEKSDTNISIHFGDDMTKQSLYFLAEKIKEPAVRNWTSEEVASRLSNTHLRHTWAQRRKNTANLQTWFGGRLWPKIEEGLVVKNGILSCWHSSYKCRK